MKEVWKDIKGYEGLYQVSNLGRVKTLGRKYPLKYTGYKTIYRTIKESIKKQRVRGGYYCVSLSMNGIKKSVGVHRLVAQEFLGNDVRVVNHKDGDKLNNVLWNLELVNIRENITHGVDKAQTTSSYIGVYRLQKKTGKIWGSCIYYQGSTVYLGCYFTELDAHLAYLKALNEFGLTNKYAS